MQDVRRVMVLVDSPCGLPFVSCEESSVGIFQVTCGPGRGLGNLQVYPNKTGRVSGNALLNIGCEARRGQVREFFLRNPWFCAVGTGGEEGAAGGQCSRLRQQGLAELLTEVKMRRGEAGLIHMQGYLEKAGLLRRREVKWMDSGSPWGTARRLPFPLPSLSLSSQFCLFLFVIFRSLV